MRGRKALRQIRIFWEELCTFVVSFTRKAGGTPAKKKKSMSSTGGAGGLRENGINWFVG